MKLLLSTLLFVTASAVDLGSVEWKQYKADHKKVYTTPKEDALRLTEYLKNKKIIEEHNQKFRRGETSYTMAVNQFADWYPEELKKLTDYKPDKRKNRGEPFELAPGPAPPESMNWVAKGAVTKVKNQMACGSCYAFSAAGALEGLLFIKNKTLTDLSPQELVDCSSNYGCLGGQITECFSYVVKRGGISTEKSYPYKAKYGKCRADKGKVGASCTGWKELPFSEIYLQNAVGTVGPVSICFAVSHDFIFYRGGVFDGKCSSMINHAMLAVGYGKDYESDTDYWLIKNSWGETWGQNGYAMVKRGKNLCDIAEENSYPVYEKKLNLEI